MLASKISNQVLPFLERAQEEVNRQQRFRVQGFGVIEDGDVIARMGIRCEEEPDMKKPALAFGVVITRIDPKKKPLARGVVIWSVPWIRDVQDGLSAYEAQTEAFELDGERLPQEFLDDLKRLLSVFTNALHRGEPSQESLANPHSQLRGAVAPLRG